MNAFSKFLKGVAHELNPKTGWIQKTGERHFDNLYTGYQFGGKAKIAGSIALLGYGGYSFNKAHNDLYRYDSEMQDVESLPGTRGDMLGYQANVGVDDAFLASGDLVFALHRLRHGG